jgi:hypothetical protein
MKGARALTWPQTLDPDFDLSFPGRVRVRSSVRLVIEEKGIILFYQSVCLVLGEDISHALSTLISSAIKSVGKHCIE